MNTIHVPVLAVGGIATTLSAPFAFQGLRVQYPEVVIAALRNLYMEYNRAFAPLVNANREWPTDGCNNMLDGRPVNWAVQIDMVGISDEMMAQLSAMPEPEVREILRRRIFEIENSLALYSILDRVCDRADGSRSTYSVQVRALLDSIRRYSGRPIALLAVTDEKYNAMRATEFGKLEGETLTDAEVREYSGFDRLFGPTEFKDYLASNEGRCGYLLYVRASDPVAKLRKPNLTVEHPLLADRELREIIKANSITLNVDDPSWPRGDARCINDTKWYMPPMGMAFAVSSYGDLLSPELNTHLQAGRPIGTFTGTNRLSDEFSAFLLRQGVNPQDVASGTVHLRAKPAQGAYGCYGHERGVLIDGEFARRVRYGIRDRGAYMVQIEQEQPQVHNTCDGVTYAYIDRVFLGMMDRPEFLGGFREFLGADTREAQSGRLHGNRDTVFAEIESM